MEEEFEDLFGAEAEFDPDGFATADEGEAIAEATRPGFVPKFIFGRLNPKWHASSASAKERISSRDNALTSLRKARRSGGDVAAARKALQSTETVREYRARLLAYIDRLKEEIAKKPGDNNRLQRNLKAAQRRLDRVNQLITKAGGNKSAKGLTTTQARKKFGESTQTALLLDEVEPDPSVEDHRTIKEAERSFEEINTLLWAALNPSDGPGYVSKGTVYCRAVYDDHVVIQDGAKLFSRTFAIDDDGKVTLGDPVEVTEHREFVKVSEAKGKVFDVLLIEAGTSKNRRRYRPEVLREAIDKFDGARSFGSAESDHNPKDRGARSLVGWFSAPRWFEGKHPVSKKTVKGIAAHYHVLESAQWLSSLLTEALDQKPDLIGFSIVGDGDLQIVREAAGAVADVTRIDRIEAIDPVINPAAGGVALRLVASVEVPMDWEKLTLVEAVKALFSGTIVPDELREHRADLAESIEAGKLGEVDATDDEKTTAQKKIAEAAPKAEPADLQEAVNAALTELRIERKLGEHAGFPAQLKESIRQETAGKALSEAEIDATFKRYADLMGVFAPQVKGSGVKDVKNERDQIQEAFDKMLSGESNASIREAYVRLTGDVDLTGRLGAQRLTESVDSSTFANVAENAITKRMLAEYSRPGMDYWRQLVDVVPKRDFKTEKRVRMGGYGDLPTVGEGQPYTALDTPGDEKVEYNISKRGGTEQLTLEAIANDDLGTIRRIPVKLARAAYLTLLKNVFDHLRTNAAIYDGVALAHADHNNLGTAALAAASLAAGRLKMKKQTEPGSNERLGIAPKFLIIPEDLEQTAYELTNTDREVGSANNTLNFAKTFGLQILPVPYWTDANDWWLAADKADVPTIELAFFNGREEPEILLQDDPKVGSVFSNDKLTWKIRHIYGSAVMDFRGFVGNIVP